MTRARLTVTREMDLDPANYRNVEWPAGSGERRDLTDPGDMIAYEQSLIDSGEVDLTEHLDGGNAEVGEQPVARWELVEEPQIMEARPVGENPFLDATKTAEIAHAPSSATSTGKNVVGDQGALTDEEYVERQRGGLRDINTVTPKFSGDTDK